METLKKQLDETCAFIRSRTLSQPYLGITLGSGLSHFAENIKIDAKIPFSDIPHFLPPTVEGHSGNLVMGYIGKIPVAILQGRVHYYEGHEMSTVVYPTRVLSQLGIKCLLLTNAAGGLDPQMSPGDFMILRDHINLTGTNPLRGPNPEFLGPRFPDMSMPYDLELRKKLADSFQKAGARFSEGVYAGVSGPCYETASEVRFLAMIGGHAVGMSTVAETIVARHCGLRVAGVSCITNKATGISDQKISHDEVKDIAQKGEKVFTNAILNFAISLESEFK